MIRSLRCSRRRIVSDSEKGVIDVPDGLNEEQTEMFLREHAAEVCGQEP
jgi:hypothetical protein